MGGSAGRAFKLPWLLLGLLCVGLGGAGMVVPGLPTTVFFISAAACFGRSSVRLERWVLGLPGIGPSVRDYRSGLGMPRRAKILALASIAVFSGVAFATLPNAPARLATLLAAVAGIAFISWRVPTRETVLARGHRLPSEPPPAQ